MGASGAEAGGVYVAREDMTERWREVTSSAKEPQAGIFGPASISWRVNRESALFLGAGRAALLQLAHPWVAAALEEHSNIREDPVRRFHNTFRVVFTMIFGTLNQAIAASQHLHELHSRIRGELPEGVGAYRRGGHYEANEVHALLWVYATLVDSALMAYESVLGPLSEAERETYYVESRTTAALFGIPQSALPGDWVALQTYMKGMWDSDALAVNALSQELGQHVLHGRNSGVPIPRWYRAVTAAWMPERLREPFGWPFGVREQRAATSALRWLPRIYRRLPGVLRFVGPYHEACARLRGRGPGVMTRANNRFWMGQARLMFTER